MHRVSRRDNPRIFYFYLLIEREDRQKDSSNNIVHMHSYMCVHRHIHLYNPPKHLYTCVHVYMYMFKSD